MEKVAANTAFLVELRALALAVLAVQVLRGYTCNFCSGLVSIASLLSLKLPVLTALQARLHGAGFGGS